MISRCSPVRGAPVRRCMRIAFLTGIWPPDVGGPATHGPDFSRFLVGRGHTVRVVTMGDGEPTERPCEVDVVSRKLPFPLRYGLVALRGARAARSADVLYASATLRGRRCRGDARAAAVRRQAHLGPGLRARAPLRALLGDDSRTSRARRSRPIRALKAVAQRVVAARRTRSSSRARSSREIAVGWGLRSATASTCSRTRRRRRATCEPEQLAPGTFVFVGRLTEAEGPADRDRGDRARARRRGSCSSATGPSAPSSSAPPQLGGRGPDRVPRVALPRRGAAGRRRRRGGRCSRAPGRTCRTARSRRSRSACRWSRRPSAACPRSSTTARTACSCRPAGPSELAAAMRRVLEEPGLRDRLAARAKPSVEAISSDGDLRPARGAARGGGRGERARRASSSSAARATGCRFRTGSRRSGTRSRSSSTTGSSAPRKPGSPLRAERFRLVGTGAAAPPGRDPLPPAAPVPRRGASCGSSGRTPSSRPIRSSVPPCSRAARSPAGRRR